MEQQCNLLVLLLTLSTMQHTVYRVEQHRDFRVAPGNQQQQCIEMEQHRVSLLRVAPGNQQQQCIEMEQHRVKLTPCCSWQPTTTSCAYAPGDGATSCQAYSVLLATEQQMCIEMEQHRVLLCVAPGNQSTVYWSNINSVAPGNNNKCIELMLLATVYRDGVSSLLRNLLLATNNNSV